MSPEVLVIPGGSRYCAPSLYDDGSQTTPFVEIKVPVSRAVSRKM